jgi:hypothetical protein
VIVDYNKTILLKIIIIKNPNADFKEEKTICACSVKKYKIIKGTRFFLVPTV